MGRMRGGCHSYFKGLTMVELLSAMVIAGIFLSIAIPGLESTIATASVRGEASRLLMGIQFARSEAIKRGQFVNMCIADAEACDVTDLSTCICKVDVPAKRYDQGWLVYTAPAANVGFDPDRDTLLWVGLPSGESIVMRSNNIIQFEIGLTPNGNFAGATGEGKIGICFQGESTDGIAGRMLIVRLTGRTELGPIAPGGECDPDPPGPPGPPGP